MPTGLHGSALNIDAVTSMSQKANDIASGNGPTFRFLDDEALPSTSLSKPCLHCLTLDINEGPRMSLEEDCVSRIDSTAACFLNRQCLPSSTLLPACLH
jgi:hypothetical protein